MRDDLPPIRVLQFDSENGFQLSTDWSEHVDVGVPDYRLTLPLTSALSRLGTAIQMADEFLRQHHPMLVMTQAGEDTALAFSLAAQRHGVPIIHMEAGLRSFDRQSSTETNRVMCDHVSGLLYTSEWVAHDNLSREGIPADRVQFVGNLLMDTIKSVLPQASQPKYTLRQLNLPTQMLKNKKGVGVVYVRAADLTTDVTRLTHLVRALKTTSAELPLIWPLDELTRALMARHGLLPSPQESQITILPIIPYHKMIGLLSAARCVLTDSTTVQEEATILGVPCLTLNDHTERRITVEQGSNIVVGHNISLIGRAVAEILRGSGKTGRLPKFWDGQSAHRVTEHLASWLKTRVNTSHKVHD